MEEQNAVALFEQKYLATFKELQALKKEQNRLEEMEKSIKSELEQAMDNHGIVSIKNDYITISRVAASETKTLDVKKLEAKEPGLYYELLEDYPKVTTKKAYIKFLVK